jgi:tRNA(Ile)-lysidine synthetase-like protein
MRHALSEAALKTALNQIPTGAWAVGVSGGADSVALLALLRERSDLRLHVVHLDHETRQGESAVDAKFVVDLAREWGIPCSIRKRSDVEREMAELPANRSARYRAVRIEFFRRTVLENELLGVILAHHADDQAETVLLRLLRGSGPLGLRGMSVRTSMRGLTILRPLLCVRRESLREVLKGRGIKWREDASNASMDQRRNRVRRMLAENPEWTDQLLRLGRACDRWVQWLARTAPTLEASFDVKCLRDLALPVAEFAARRWLAERSGRLESITTDAARRLVEMATDAASPAQQHFAGGILVRRRRTRIFAEITEASLASKRETGASRTTES